MAQSLDSHPDVLLVRKHLVEHLGPPDEVFEVSGSPIPNSPVQALNLAYFAPAGPASPVVFSTCGASLYRMLDGRRVEALVLLRREPDPLGFDAVNKLLGAFALFAESTGQVVRVGDVVRAPNELVGFCQMDAVLFLPPVPFVPKFHTVDVANGELVELIWLLPVYESEATYAMKHGPQALMMLFAAQSLDLTDPQRAEANTMLAPEDASQQAKRLTEENQQKSAEQQKGPVLQAGKTKTSRRDVGKGSFDVAEAGTTVTVARRQKTGKTVVTPAIEAAAPVPTQTQVQAQAAEPNRAAPPKAEIKRRRLTAEVPEQKQEIRFDLNATDPKVTAARSSALEPPKPSPPSEESPAARKKRRIAELIQKAKEAAERAKLRRAGQRSTLPVPSSDNANRTLAGPKAAAKRRGAPTKAIHGQIGGKDPDES